MNSKERILAALEGKPADHVPLTTWCFGLKPPKHLVWSRGGIAREFWYSLRMEHLHSLPQPWTLEDDFKRVETWLSLGIDDLLDVSVPWSQAPEVHYVDQTEPAGKLDPHPVMVRTYDTPAGALRHAVRQTEEDPGPGWVVQPDCVPLIEDYNIPRAVEHLISTSADVAGIPYLYTGPDGKAKEWFAERMDHVETFAQDKGVLVQAWTAFGMDAVVWFAGTEGAIMLALDKPKAFAELVQTIAQTDYARTELAVNHPGVDMVVQRGWYSSTDFWSPNLFDEHVWGHTKRLADLAHAHNKKFAYVMTTGVEILVPRLADAGVDLLYFVDPVQDHVDLENLKNLVGERMTLVGGTNAVSLAQPAPQAIRRNVETAMNTLGPTNRFILHPVDAVFPDTPWEGIEQMIQAWQACC